MPRIDKAIETGSRLAVTYGCGFRGRNEERSLMRMGFLSGWRKCPESGCSGVCITVNIVKIIELHILNGWIICYIHYILIKFSPKNLCKIFASTSSGRNRQHATPYVEKKLRKSSYRKILLSSIICPSIPAKHSSALFRWTSESLRELKTYPSLVKFFETKACWKS